MEIALLFLFDHGRQSVQLAPGVTEDRIFANPVDQFQEERFPRLDQDEPAICFEDAMNFGENLLQIRFERRQVMKTALH